MGVAAVLLASCDEEQEDVREPTPVAAAAPDAGRASWLDLTDETRPEVWLASRETGASQPPGGDAAAGYLRLLQDAARRFNETPRMIANRTVQLETMLAEHGIDENARTILSGFLSSAAAGAVQRDYGSLCHHYFNLRSTGVDRAAALAVLAADPPAPP